MTRLDALRALLAKVEAGAVSAADAPMIHAAFGRWVRDEATVYLVVAIMNNTLEAEGAARALHEAALPEWRWDIGSGDGKSDVWISRMIVDEDGDEIEVEWGCDGLLMQPARALLACDLRALIAQEEAKE